MDIVTIILLSLNLLILIILLIIVIIKNKDKDNTNLDMMERLGHFESSINKDISSFKIEFEKELLKDFTNINNQIETKLDNINNKVHERIDKNFENTNKTFINVLERLNKIDEAQKKIDSLQTDIVSLESILTDKKSRGIFGEVNLNNILISVFGEKKTLYDIQHKLSNNTIADSVVFAPKPLGMIAIDSKFPLEHYRKMVDKKLDEQTRKESEKLFKVDVKKHIDDIANKYIIDGETSDQAMMFIPAEAIFAELNAYHYELIEYAYNKRVWIASPTTLISTLTMIMMSVQNIERDKYASVIHDELKKLGIEFNRFKERFDKLSRSVKSVNTDIENFQITTDKIKKRFDSISNAELNSEENIEIEEEI